MNETLNKFLTEATGDLSVYVDCEKLATCRTKCYNRLLRFKNALHKVDEISKEIQSDFDGDVPLRFKRMSKDSSSTLDAKRGLIFAFPVCSPTKRNYKVKLLQASSMRFLLEALVSARFFRGLVPHLHTTAARLEK